MCGDNLAMEYVYYCIYSLERTGICILETRRSRGNHHPCPSSWHAWTQMAESSSILHKSTHATHILLHSVLILLSLLHYRPHALSFEARSSNPYDTIDYTRSVGTAATKLVTRRQIRLTDRPFTPLIAACGPASARRRRCRRVLDQSPAGRRPRNLETTTQQ